MAGTDRERPRLRVGASLVGARPQPAPGEEPMAGSDRERLRRMLQERSFITGTFKLSSGATSSYFFDGKQVTLDPAGAHLAGEAVLQLIRERAPEATAVAGPTVGADPIVSAVMLLSAATDQPLAGLLVRSERKDHGTERIIEGPLQRGMRVVIVDDAATTGRVIGPHGALPARSRPGSRGRPGDHTGRPPVRLRGRHGGDRRPRSQRVHPRRLRAAGVGKEARACGRRRIGRQASHGQGC